MSVEAETVVPEAASARRNQRLVAVASAVVGAVACWVLIEGIVGIDLHAPTFGEASANQDIGVAAVVVTSLVASLLAWGLLAVLERLSSRPRRNWTILALVGLVASLGGPLTGDGINPGNRGFLALLHVIVAATLIPLLYRTAPTEGRPG